MPIPVTCPECRFSSTFRDELAGMEVRCPGCRGVLVVPRGGPPPLPGSVAGPRAPFDRDEFLIPRPLWSSAARYEVCDAGGKPVLFLERPARFKPGPVAGCFGMMVMLFLLTLVIAAAATVGLNYGTAAGIAVGVVGAVLALLVRGAAIRAVSPPRRARFFDDRKGGSLLLEVEQKRGEFVCARPGGHPAGGEVLGRFASDGNFFRKSWCCRDATGRVVAVAREDSVVYAVLRRTARHLIGLVPGSTFLKPLQLVLGGNLGLLPTNFLIFAPDRQTVVGHFTRGLTGLKPYALDLTGEAARDLDRRLLVALAVVVDVDERS